MAPPPAAAPIDSFVAERDSLMKEVLARIAGRETMPAESVFKNLKSEHPTVNCTTCHRGSRKPALNL